MCARLWVMVLFVVGCEQGTSREPTASQCSAAAASLAKIAVTKDEKRDAVKAVVSERCHADRWSREAVSCLAKVADADAEHQCGYKHLTHEQKDKLDEALGPLLESAALAKMSEFMDKMCACADPECAKRVSDEMTQWSMEMVKKQRAPVKLSEADQKRATEIGTRMGECMQRALTEPSAR